jgi:hypothetical protein
MGVENYVATLKFTPVTDGARRFAEWSAEFDCDESRERPNCPSRSAPACSRAAFDALKRNLGGKF